MNNAIRARIQEVSDLLIQRNLAERDTIIPCTAREVHEIEQVVGHTIPLAYREFLLTMGKKAGAFYVGTDLFYPQILNLVRAAHELLEEDKAEIQLPDNAIPFVMYQGYQFAFIQADEGDDPPVYYYLEDSGAFIKKADRLSQFLLNAAHDDW